MWCIRVLFIINNRHARESQFLQSCISKNAFGLCSFASGKNYTGHTPPLELSYHLSHGCCTFGTPILAVTSRQSVNTATSPERSPASKYGWLMSTERGSLKQCRRLRFGVGLLDDSAPFHFSHRHFRIFGRSLVLYHPTQLSHINSEPYELF